MSKRFDQHDSVKSVHYSRLLLHGWDLILGFAVQEATAEDITGVQADVDNDEATRIAQMFAQSDQQWEQQQDKMAT